MNDQSQKVFRNMLHLLTRFNQNEINIGHLVDSLEGSIDALEEKLPETWRNRWFMEMIDLESYRALGLEKSRKLDILRTVDRIRQLIVEILGQSEAKS